MNAMKITPGNMYVPAKTDVPLSNSTKKVKFLFLLLSSQRCFSAEELVQILGLADQSSASSVMDRSTMGRLSPALIQQILSRACTDVTEPETPDELSKTDSKSVENVFCFLLFV